MNILSLYCGIGGHTALIPCQTHIDAVDINRHILNVYKDLYPYHSVFCDDAYMFLHYNKAKYDFIFATPPPRNEQLTALLIELLNTPVISYCVQICSLDFKPKHPVQRILTYEFLCSFDISWRNPVVKPKSKPFGKVTQEMINNMLPPEIGLHIYHCLLASKNVK